jgi:threonine/homoserine/homoserine lactone efflux protein
MLLFLPPVVGVLIGLALLVAGVAAHIVILEVVGGVVLVAGGYRWLRKRRDGGAAQ